MEENQSINGFTGDLWPGSLSRRAFLAKLAVVAGQSAEAAAVAARAIASGVSQDTSSSLTSDDLPPQHRSLGAAAAAREVLSTPAAATSNGSGLARRTGSLIIEARVKGYEGEACGECGNFTLVRNGTCLKCDTCGGTSGCS